MFSVRKILTIFVALAIVFSAPAAESFGLPGTHGNDYLVSASTKNPSTANEENKLEFGVKGQGTISLKPSGIESGDIVLAGISLKFTATPAPGWKFDQWRWTNEGGEDIVSGGEARDDGTNTETFTMPDNSAVLYAVFKKETIDVAISGDVELSYINDGSDPLRDMGEIIDTDNGRDVPKGVDVRVKLKPGIVPAPGTKWTVTATTSEGMVDIPVDEITWQGRPECGFKLEHPSDPDIELTGCAVSIDTLKGRYTVQAMNQFDDRVDFGIFVDGNEMDRNPVTDIEAGSLIEVKAKVRRGYTIDYWKVNGKEEDIKDNTYSTVLTGNAIIQTETSSDTKVDLKLKTEGGGKGKYVITDKNGDPIEGTFEGTDETVVSPVYKGESVILSAADDEEEYAMTAVTVNGEEVELKDGKAEIKELNADTEVVCSFRSNAYRSLNFSKSVRKYEPTIFDSNGQEVETGKSIKVPKGGSYDFSVVIDKDAPIAVQATGGYTGKLEPAGDPVLQPDGKSLKYSYTLTNFKADTHVTIFDHNVMYISNGRELADYFEAMVANESTPDKQPDGILINNIKGPVQIDAVPRQYAGTFDGQGHYMWDVSFGSSERCIQGFYGVFGNLLPGSCVKDVTLFDVDVYGSTPDTSGYSGMLTYNNQGTISNVAVTGATGASLFSLKFTEGAAAIAYDNHGTIENCLVRGLTVENQQTSDYAYAVGVSVFNQSRDGEVDGNGTIRGCYVEDLKYKSFNAGEGSLVTNTVISLKMDKNYGLYSNNYFRATYAASAEHGGKVYGTNVCTLTKDSTDEEKAEAEVKTPEFARKLAWTLNDKAGDKIWGLTGSDNEDSAIRPIGLTLPGAEAAVAPIKVDFASAKPITKYYLPGMNELPKVSNPQFYVGWVIGGIAYDPYGDMPVMVELTEDQEVELALNPDEWPIMLSHKDGDSRFDIRLYQDVKKAMKDAEADPGLLSQELRLRGNLTMGNFAFTVGEKTSVIFEQDAKFTMESGSQITNMGTIYFSNKNGSNQYHKYGTIVNYGHIKIDINGFYNYGSIFDNQDSGRIVEREWIICRPHVNNEWTYADGPETEGEHEHEWKKTSTCSVCGTELTEYIKPNPPESKVRSIELMEEPGKTNYEVGEEFTDEGMVVIANLKDGTKALITDYKMLLKMDDGEEEEVNNGEVLSTAANAKLTVNYGEFKTEPIDIAIVNTSPEPTPDPKPTPGPKPSDPDDENNGKLTITLSKKTFIYDGKSKMPSITVKSGNKILAKNIKKSNSKFMVIMFNDKHRNPGTYKIVVMARDRHYGMGEASFKIAVKPTKIKKVKKGRRSMTVKWKKVNKKHVKGYLVRYSTNKNMKKAKYKYVKKWNKTNLKVRKLKKGKKYYVQVRTYYKTRGIFYYSKWTAKKTVKPL